CGGAATRSASVLNDTSDRPRAQRRWGGSLEPECPIDLPEHRAPIPRPRHGLRRACPCGALSGCAILVRLDPLVAGRQLRRDGSFRGSAAGCGGLLGLAQQRLGYALAGRIEGFARGALSAGEAFRVLQQRKESRIRLLDGQPRIGAVEEFLRGAPAGLGPRSAGRLFRASEAVEFLLSLASQCRRLLRVAAARHAGHRDHNGQSCCCRPHLPPYPASAIGYRDAREPVKEPATKGSAVCAWQRAAKTPRIDPNEAED